MRMYFACKIFLVSCSVLSATSSMARADLITFEREHDFDPIQLDGKVVGSIIRQGLTATFTANVGELNVTGSSFGINVLETADLPSVLDTFEGTVESITITFNKPVEFTQLTLNAFTPGETAMLTVGRNTTESLDALPPGIDVYNFTDSSFTNNGNRIDLGQSLVVGSGTGNGFSLEGFQVNVVPEPTCLSIALPVLAGMLLRRRREEDVVCQTDKR